MLVYVHLKNVAAFIRTAERVLTCRVQVAAAAPNFNVAILKTEEFLGSEACACQDNFTLVLVAGAAMTMTKAATLDFSGLILGVNLTEVFSKSTAHNPNAMNGMIFTACAAAVVKATVLTIYLAIVTVAIGIKATDWQ